MKTLRFSLTAVAVVACLASASAASATQAPKSTQTVKLLRSQNAFKAARASSSVVRRVPATTPILGTPYVLPVLSSKTVKSNRWVRVRLPGRPNGSRGWMKADAMQKGKTTWAVGVNLSARSATVYRKGKVVRRFRVIVGKSSTPTPTGHFFVTEKIAQPAPYILGPWVLALNGYSDVLFSFAGGPGQIALHGKGKLNAPLGSAASNGCIRFADKDSRWLAAKLPVGTPVSISRSSTRVTASAASAKHLHFISAQPLGFVMPGTTLNTIIW